ncbi:MAG: hypothetical protein M5U14_16100 [Acidimicrobiia bacterium]|nr:hypothetical protein [Acidimicrobiia bacterium]
MVEDRAQVARAEAIAETERWFLRRGVPHFIDRYNASEDILTRIVPLLTLVFVVEVLLATKWGWAWWLNALAVAGGFGILLGGWALANRARGRPALARPVDVGPVEVVAFVVLPALLPFVFGGQVRDAVLTALANLLLLAAVFLVASYGLVPMTRWAAGRLGRELGAVLGLLVRALPLLLLFVTFLFVNAEVWQLASNLRWPAVLTVVALFAAVGTLFAAMRLPRQIGELTREEPWEDVRERVRGTPAAALVELAPPGASPPLGRRQWGNLGLVVLVSEGIQVILVSLLVGGFFVLLGFLAVSSDTAGAWLGHPPEVLATVELWDQEMVLTREVLKVAVFLGGFTGFFFTVSLLVDATYQQEFLQDLLDEVRESLAVRAVYLGALVREPGGTEASPASTMSET